MVDKIAMMLVLLLLGCGGTAGPDFIRTCFSVCENNGGLRIIDAEFHGEGTCTCENRVEYRYYKKATERR